MCPGTFAGLMELYERNYMLLKQLFADHDPSVTYAVHYPDRRHRLESTLLERGPYTSTMLLSYSLLNRRHPLVHPVQLKIRVYHDARQAELFRPAEHLTAAAVCSGAGHDAVALRWVLNRFLNGVLTMFYCRGSRLVCRKNPSGATMERRKNPGGTSNESKN